MESKYHTNDINTSKFRGPTLNVFELSKKFLWVCISPSSKLTLIQQNLCENYFLIMGEFWGSLHVCNRKTKSNKCNEVDAAIHCWTFPFDVTYTKPGLHRDPPKQHTLSKGHTWMEFRETAPSTQKAASTRGTHLLSLQTLPCTPELTKPWLVFLHHPWLWSTPSRNNQMKTRGLTSHGVPMSVHPDNWPWVPWTISANKGHWNHEETSVQQPKQKEFPSTGCTQVWT